MRMESPMNSTIILKKTMCLFNIKFILNFFVSANKVLNYISQNFQKYPRNRIKIIIFID